MERAKGILYAALSSSTFGLAPLFTLLLLGLGYSSFEVLSYRWGVASLFLGALALLAGRSFRLSWPELRTVFFLSLFRAATSLSLVIAYQHIASGVASTIHFMYPLAVALAMMCFFREKGSVWVFAAIGMSIVGAVLLSLGNVDFTRGNTTLGMVSAAVSVACVSLAKLTTAADCAIHWQRNISRLKGPQKPLTHCCRSGSVKPIHEPASVNQP